MTREKRNKIVLLITIFGIILLLITGTLIKVNNYNKEQEETKLKSMLLSISKTCIEQNKCTSDTITVKELDDFNLIDKTTKMELDSYNSNSYIIYSLKEVYLIK